MITQSAVFKMHSFGTIWVGCCHLRLGKSAKKKGKKTFSWNIKSLILVYNQNQVLVLGTETKVQFQYRISSYSFCGNYSFLNSQIVANSNNCQNILIFYLINWISVAETIQGQKLCQEIRFRGCPLSTIFGT